MQASLTSAIPMPRRPRLLVAGIPLHITQRGVNRGATFVDADDHRRYRDLLAEQQRALGSPRLPAMVAKVLNRPVQVRPRGRPRTVALSDENSNE